MEQLKVFITVAILAAIGCTKEADIKLVNQPLNVVQERLNGRWRVAYWEGGISGSHIDGKNGEYFAFSAATIQSGDDNAEKLNAPITWKKVRWGNPGDSTYVLTYGSSNFPNAYLVYQIKDGVLQLQQYDLDDGYTVYLKRW